MAVLNRGLIKGLDFCKSCGAFICLDTMAESVTLWIDDDTGDSYCEPGFMNFHSPIHGNEAHGL